MSGARPEDRVLDVCTGDVAWKKGKDNRVRFLQMDATRLDFVNKQFDVSTISFGLRDMPPEVMEGALREMARVTRRRIVIVDYNYNSPSSAGCRWEGRRRLISGSCRYAPAAQMRRAKGDLAGGQIFDWFAHLEESYLAWHPQDYIEEGLSIASTQQR